MKPQVFTELERKIHKNHLNQTSMWMILLCCRAPVDTTVHTPSSWLSEPNPRPKTPSSYPPWKVKVSPFCCKHEWCPIPNIASQDQMVASRFFSFLLGFGFSRAFAVSFQGVFWTNSAPWWLRATDQSRFCASSGFAGNKQVMLAVVGGSPTEY